MAVRQLNLELPPKDGPTYPIIFADGLYQHLAEHITETTIALITDEHIAHYHAELVVAALASAGKTLHTYTVPAGEASKSLTTYGSLLSAMLQDGLDRHSAVLALGGGVVGDLAGFVAASFMRGIEVYQCPTSLLAMVDSSVGGKTGVNTPEGKNLVGAFWQPKAVLVDVNALRTLPDHTFREGAVELFKHGLLADETLATAFKDPRFTPMGETEYWLELLPRAVRVKADIVMEDETEQGVRAFLNLGHTLGHALESYSHAHTEVGYAPLSHGEAVAYGLVFAAKLSAQRGYADETRRCLEFLQWLKPKPLHDSLTNETFDQLSSYLYNDKKAHDKQLRWILLEAVGKPIIVDDIHQTELQAAWRYLLANTQGLPV
ncbi:MAG: 3-dehydroquinate synthase [Deinococcota bacterium]